MNNQVQAQFTSRVPIYDRRSNWIMDPGLVNAMVSMARPFPEAELLDVCCGTGVIGGAFAGKVKRRVGLDLTAAMLEQARTRMDEVVQGNAYALPFPAASFDMVVLRQALHFLETPEKAVLEMFRVLRPGGQVVIGHRVPYEEADTEWMSVLNILKQPLMKTFITDNLLLNALSGSGFSDIETKNYYLRENIQEWVTSPETPEENRPKVIAHCRQAPPEVLAVHPIELLPDGGVFATWRWVVFSAFKPRG